MSMQITLPIIFQNLSKIGYLSNNIVRLFQPGYPDCYFYEYDCVSVSYRETLLNREYPHEFHVKYVPGNDDLDGYLDTFYYAN
jgi:hypothetical protein